MRPEDAEELCVQTIFIFRDHGSREARSRARLAFLVDAWGVERLRDEVEAHMGKPLERAGVDLRRTYEADHVGVTQLRQPDTYAVGLAVPVGRLHALQVEQAALAADSFGDGTVRLTPTQNLVLTGIPGSRLGALLAEPLLTTLRHDPPPSIRGTVACTGIGLCDLALTDTKNDALAVARQLAQRLPAWRRPMSNQLVRLPSRLWQSPRRGHWLAGRQGADRRRRAGGLSDLRRRPIRQERTSRDGAGSPGASSGAR